MPNRNTLAATVFVDELARSGLKHAVLAPGSRHTPLVLAFAEHPDIIVHSHLDERSASFYALGLALGTDQPVALCCTSGTAGANFYPAIIEAHQSRVPLIVLTADRPPELRHSGANQTIDQIKMFGEFVLWFVDAALPEANPPAVAIRNLRTTANRAYATANGLRKGVVHINMPFRKPLEPTEVDGDMVESTNMQSNRSPAAYLSGTKSIFANDADTHTLFDLVESHPKGIVICAHNSPKGKQNGLFSQEVLNFARLAGYPVFAEMSSNVRVSKRRDHLNPIVISSYENMGLELVDDQLKPDIVIRFGDVPTSKKINDFIIKLQPNAYVYISDHGDWADDSHLITHYFQREEEGICLMLAHEMRQSRLETAKVESINSSLITHYASLEKITWQTIETQLSTGLYFDGGVAYDIVDLIPPESTLFAGNSLPIRLLDQFGKPQEKRIYVHANRGASGIDGNISTALGLGKARPDKPLVALIGDVTFYHDMNGLLAVHRCGVPVTIVLLNNDGGGIFHRLPIKDYDPHFTDLFVTPHDLDYEHAAKLYGLDFVRLNGHAPDARAQFRKVFSERVELSKAGQSTIIEVMTDTKTDLARRDEIVKAVHTAINQV